MAMRRLFAPGDGLARSADRVLIFMRRPVKLARRSRIGWRVRSRRGYAPVVCNVKFQPERAYSSLPWRAARVESGPGFPYFGTEGATPWLSRPATSERHAGREGCEPRRRSRQRRRYRVCARLQARVPAIRPSRPLSGKINETASRIGDLLVGMNGRSRIFGFYMREDVVAIGVRKLRPDEPDLTRRAFLKSSELTDGREHGSSVANPLLACWWRSMRARCRDRYRHPLGARRLK